LGHSIGYISITSLAHVAGMIIYLGYGVWHSSERCHDDTQVMIMDDVTDKDSSK